MEKRTARDFSRKEEYEVALLYASSYQEFSANVIAEALGVSESTCRTVLDNAVIHNVVNDKIVRLMSEKAARNAQIHAGIKGKYSSLKHYETLRAKRAAYLPSKREIIIIVKSYAESDLPKECFSQTHYITKQLLTKLIHLAIVNCYVNDKTVDLLKAKSIERYGLSDVEDFWKEILNNRNENKKRG